jgi:serine/threonine-protein kinase
MGRVDLMLRREGSFQRLYAVKRLHPEHRSDEAFRRMFLDEARLAGLVRHTNVVSVLDVGEDAEGPYLVMDYVEGVPVSEIIRHHRGTERLLPLQLVLRIVSQAAAGLQAAHDLRAADGSPLGLIHRDVSPQNVLVGYDGAARLTDFGVAKAMGQQSRTSTGVLKGKLGYMAPEQLRFEKPTQRSDLFSLGVVLYELLSAERLYPTGEEMEGARRLLNEPPPDLGTLRDDVPPALVELGFEMLSKDPEARPETAREVVSRIDEMLGELVASEGTIDLSEYMQEVFAERRERERARIAEATAMARAPGSASPHSKRPGRGRGPWWVWASAAAVLLAGGGLALAMRGDGSAPSTMASAEAGQGTTSASATVTDGGTDAEARGPAAQDAGGGGASEAQADAGGAAEPQPEKPTRPRRRARPRRTARPDPKQKRVPMWSWD